MAVKETRHFSRWDPHKIYNGSELVYFEAFCACGAIRRVRGEARDVITHFVQPFYALHSGKGHGEVTLLEAARARNIAREQAHLDGQARGFISPDEEFVPEDWDSKRINLTNEEVYGQ